MFVEYTEYLIKDFPLLRQLDNEKNPFGSCNLTSVAACAYFFEKKRDPRYKRFEQFEDEMQARAEDNAWDRHESSTMKKIAELYGLTDELIETSDWQATGKAVYKAIAHLKSGNPIIVHTYLTKIGHISPIDGVRLIDGKPVQWHFADPYGEFYPQGYAQAWGNIPDLGRYWLSHSQFVQRILTDGAFWVHLVGRGDS